MREGTCVREGDAHYRYEGVKVRLPLCSTLLTETTGEKTRHPAVVLALSETGAQFSSGQRVTPGEAVGVILHPDLRYAIRGHVTWTRRMPDDNQIHFGMAFEEGIPESLWDVLGATVAA
jgi:PilZ domain